MVVVLETLDQFRLKQLWNAVSPLKGLENQDGLTGRKQHLLCLKHHDRRGHRMAICPLIAFLGSGKLSGARKL